MCEATTTDLSKDAPEAAPQWLNGKKFGYVLLWILGLLWMIAPLIAVPVGHFISMECAKRHPWYVLAWATSAALAYPAFAALENQCFESWVRHKTVAQRLVERAAFKTNTDLTKNFWAAVLGIYAAFLAVLALLKP
jgi:hypothetical protein